MEQALVTACGKCGREMKSARAWCVYCGWTADQAAPSHLPEVRAETFRAGGTVFPLIVAAIVLGTVAYFLLSHALCEAQDGIDVAFETTLSILLAYLGPAQCLFQLCRRRLSWVRVDPPRGLLLPGDAEISWRAIESVERRIGPFSRPRSIASYAEWLPRGMLGFKLSYFLIPILFAYYLVLPFLSAVSPWHSRVVVRLKDGGTIVLRDLRDDDRFVRYVRTRMG